ncbi:MAG: hypothetical protein ACRDON_03740 [Gaiellaceae bacterium]
MLARTLMTCALALGFAAGCAGGDDDSADDPLLAKSSFKAVVTSELRKAGLEAEGGFGARVVVTEELDRVEVVLDEPFAEYRSEPDRRAEILAALVAETKRRLDEGVSGLSFAEARDSLMPLLKPRFAVRRLEEEPVQTGFLANLVVVYAVEREHDFALVGRDDARDWGVAPRELHRIALDNLLRRTNAEEKLLCEPSDGQELCGWASGDGYDATRMIVPGLRRQIESEIGRAVYAVPMENVFIALPYDVATHENTVEALRTKVLHDFTVAKNPVSPKLFAVQGGRLVLLS